MNEFCWSLLSVANKKVKREWSDIVFFVFRFCAFLFMIIRFPFIFSGIYFLYRTFLSNLSFIDNNLFMSRTDIYLLNLTKLQQIKLFLFQREFLNNSLNKISYIFASVIILLVYSRIDVLMSLIAIEILFLFIEGMFFFGNYPSNDSILTFKICFEAFCFCAIIIYCVVKKNSLYIFLDLDWFHFYLIMLIYFVYILVFICYFSKIKNVRTNIVRRLFFKRIGIYTYKELLLFYRKIISNLLTILMIIIFFLFDFAKLSKLSDNLMYQLYIFSILTSDVILCRIKNKVLNLCNDNYFLNKKSFSEEDSKKILFNKLHASFQISFIVKFCFIVGITIYFSEWKFPQFLLILFLMIILILNELNSFNLNNKINFVINLIYKYVLASVILINIYIGLYFFVGIILLVIFFMEGKGIYNEIMGKK